VDCAWTSYIRIYTRVHARRACAWKRTTSLLGPSTIDHSSPPVTLRCVYIARFNPFLTRVATGEEAQGSYGKKRSSSAPRCRRKTRAHGAPWCFSARNFRSAKIAIIDVKGWGQSRENLNWITRNSVGRKIYYADVQREREREGEGRISTCANFWYMYVAVAKKLWISCDRNRNITF